MTGIIAPNPKFYVFTRCGAPAVDGFLITRDYITGAPKSTYSDPGLTTPNPFTMRIGSDGAVQYPLYWDLGNDGDQYYWVQAFDSAGQLIYSFKPYPVVDGNGGGDVTVLTESENFFLNEQFTFWSYGTNFDNTSLPVGATEIADDWYFERSNTNATIEVNQYVFASGENLVPFSPPYCFEYVVTSASADTAQGLYQTFLNVQTLNNQQVSIGFWGATGNIGQTAPITLVVEQNFGTGGSPTVTTTFDTFVINDTFSFYGTTIVIPTIVGQNIGANSFLKIAFRFDPTVIQITRMVDMQFQSGAGTGINFPYTTNDLQYVKTLQDRLAGYRDTQGTNIIGWDANFTLKQYLLELNSLSNSQEFAIGWAFGANPNQFGSIINSVTNATYIADQTILVSNGNGVVNKLNGPYESLELQVAIASEKFGIFQIVDPNFTNFIQAYYTSLFCNVGPSTGITTFKAAILGWNGAPNGETRNCVASWNAPGTNPSLSAGWNYASSVAEFQSTAFTNTQFELNGMTLPPYDIYGILVWNDSANIPLGQSAIFTNIGFRNSYIAGYNNATDPVAVLQYLQRFYQRSYPVSVASGSATYPNGILYRTTAIYNSLPERLEINESYYKLIFNVEMIKQPSIVIYGNGAINNVLLSIPELVPPYLAFDPVTIRSVDVTGFIISNNFFQQSPITIIGTIDPALVYFDYVANATLGV